MESDGGDEEAELNILQGFDDSTWLLTSPTKSPGAGDAETFTVAPCSEPKLDAEGRLCLVNRLDSILKRQQCRVDLVNSPPPSPLPPSKLSQTAVSTSGEPMGPSYHSYFALPLLPAAAPQSCLEADADSVLERRLTSSPDRTESSCPDPPASLMSPPPQILPPRLASTPSCKLSLRPTRGNSQEFELSPVMMGLEEVDLDLASLSFDCLPALDVTKDITGGDMLNLTKPFIQAEKSLDMELSLADLNRTKDLPDPTIVSTQDLVVTQPGETLANLTQNLYMNITRDLDMNLAKDLDMGIANNPGMNLTHDLEVNTRANLTQNLEMAEEPSISSSVHKLAVEDPVDPRNPLSHAPNLNSTQTLESNQDVATQAKQTPTFSLESGLNQDNQNFSLCTEGFQDIPCNSVSQSESPSPQDQDYSVPAPLNVSMSPHIVNQSGFNCTETLINPTEPEAPWTHPEQMPLSSKTNAVEELRKENLGETYHRANILRETTNKIVEKDANQYQNRILGKGKPGTLERLRKDPMKLKLKPVGGTSGLRLQKSDQEHSKKFQSQDENSSCQFKQPAMPKIGRVSNQIVRQRSMGSLNRQSSSDRLVERPMGTLTQRPTKPSSEHLVGGKTAPGIESKVKLLKRRSSAGCGVRVLAPPQLLAPVQPRVIPPALHPTEVSAPISRLRLPNRIPSIAGSRLRPPGSISRLPFLGQKPKL